MIKIFKNLNLLEKKDHIIRKMPNLTSEQKEEIINFFNKCPNYENGIDWNEWETLIYEDFKNILKIDPRIQGREFVKISGIKELKRGDDYIQLKKAPNNVQEYTPLDYKASKFIISEKEIGFEHWITKAEILKEAKFKFDGPTQIIWLSGTWKNGTWKNGTWKDGIWENGTWQTGTWENGTWKNGTWEDGIWKNGTWKFGTWKGGVWNDGIWVMGIWKDGNWKDGAWKGGEIWNLETRKYEYSDKNPYECEWSLSYRKFPYQY